MVHLSSKICNILAKRGKSGKKPEITYMKGYTTREKSLKN